MTRHEHARAALIEAGVPAGMIADGLETPGWSTWPAVVTDGTTTVGVAYDEVRFLVPHPVAEEPLAVTDLVAHLRDRHGLDIPEGGAMHTIVIRWDHASDDGHAYERFDERGVLVESGPAFAGVVPRQQALEEPETCVRAAGLDIGLFFGEAKEYGSDDGGWAVWEVDPCFEI